MVESGQNAIYPVDFASRIHARLPVEVVDVRDLMRRVEPAQLSAPQRPSFYALVLMRSARGSHIVDFTEIPSRPGRLVMVRPGQVQRWNTESDLDATLVLSQPAVPSARPWFPGHRSYCDLDGDGQGTADSLVHLLRRQQASFDGSEASTRLMASLFDALVALFDQGPAGTRGAHHSDVYLEFRNAIELDLDHRHHVTDYARNLGYSARTITRACQQATGQTAKRVLADRIVLEAKRLLVHTEMTAATISAQLGFSEPTNFTKFFSRNTAQSPTSFRSSHQRTS